MASDPIVSERSHLGSNLVQSPPADDLVPELTTSSDVELEEQMSYASPPAVKADVVTKEITSIPVAPEPVTSLVSPPTSLAGERLSPAQSNVDTRPSVEGEHESEHPTVLHTPTSSSRHSSRQPRQVDRFVPEVQTPKVTTKRSSTGAAAAVTVTVVHKPTPTPQSMKKPSSRPASSHTKKSVSPAMDKKAAATAAAAASASPRTQHGKGMKRDRASFTESETDLESLRLIRELQEQEFGLRRRAARV